MVEQRAFFVTAQSTRQYSPVGTLWHFSGTKGVSGRWGVEKQCQEAEYAVAPRSRSVVSLE